MRVLVDTSIWSLALRRRQPVEDERVLELVELIQEGRIAMIGAIRQELLSGVKSPHQFRTLCDRLGAFPDLGLVEADFEEAARCYNRCRAKGVQGSNTDFLLCAISLRHGFPIFTADADFDLYSRLLGFKLHPPRR